MSYIDPCSRSGTAHAFFPTRLHARGIPRPVRIRPIALSPSALAGCRPATRGGCGRRLRGGQKSRHDLQGVPVHSNRRWMRSGVSSRSRRPVVTYADAELYNLGNDLITFLGATVVVVPLCKRFDISPLLGFLITGFLLDDIGAFKDEEVLDSLAELGVTFLLFEMGLELSFDRLKALAKYAFIYGALQIATCTIGFTAFQLPVANGIGSIFLETVFQAPPALVDIRSIDEAIIIGAGLSLSSSAFVLQLLSERGALNTKVGSATLGILLAQDIAVVPLLVLLPLIEAPQVGADADAGAMGLFAALLPTLGKAVGGLGFLLLTGRTVLRKLFEVVAEARSSTAFVAMCLLTVCGISLLTEELGISSTLGAFLAGVLLAETNFRAKVEVDIQPFRGLLLALFFVTTGTSIDAELLRTQFPSVLALTAGVIIIKTAIITAWGPVVGLTRAESFRTGLLLSQGGEFAFVLFTLANKLDVLPKDLNDLLIIVVVLSMGLTPLLEDLGSKLTKPSTESPPTLADQMEGMSMEEQTALVSRQSSASSEYIVIVGFGQAGQTISNLMMSPFIMEGSDQAPGLSVVAFDLEMERVRAAQSQGLPVYFGDGSQKEVLDAAGIKNPKAVIVTYAKRDRITAAVERIRGSYGDDLRVYARAKDAAHVVQLQNAGASACIAETATLSFAMGNCVLQDLGVPRSDVELASSALDNSILTRAMEKVAEGSMGGSSMDRDLYIYNTPFMARKDGEDASATGDNWSRTKDDAVLVPAGGSSIDCGDSDTIEECIVDAYLLETDAETDAGAIASKPPI